MRAHRHFVFGVSWVIAAVLPTIAVASSVAQNDFQLVLLAKPNLQHGSALFDTCAACHGPTGAGARDGSVPMIGGQHFKVIARQLVDFGHGKRWDERMSHFANEHHLRDAQDIADVSAYANALFPADASSVGPGEYVARGEQLYIHVCASCHGSDAAGDGVRAIPRLAGQHYDYLLRQMHDIAERRRPDYSPNHLVLFGRLQEEDFIGVADYLSRLATNSH